MLIDRQISGFEPKEYWSDWNNILLFEKIGSVSIAE